MDVIERIKRDVDMLGHDADCVVGMRSYDGTFILKCDCGYASKLAFLDRLREPTEDLRFILGYPNYRAGVMARDLRAIGHDIPAKAEDEQAYCIHWMLLLYLEHGNGWAAVAANELQGWGAPQAAQEGL